VGRNVGRMGVGMDTPTPLSLSSTYDVLVGSRLDILVLALYSTLSAHAADDFRIKDPLHNIRALLSTLSVQSPSS